MKATSSSRSCDALRGGSGSPGARRQLEPRERVDRDGVGVDAVRRRSGRRRRRSRSGARRRGRRARAGRPGRSGPRSRSPCTSLDRFCPGRKLIGAATDEFRGRPGRTGRTQRAEDSMTIDDTRKKWLALIRPLPRRPDDRARRLDRERRAAVDPRGPRLLGGVAGVGAQRLHAHVRRLHAPRRPARRPLRPPARVRARRRRSSRSPRSPAGSRPRRRCSSARARSRASAARSSPPSRSR